jgi:antitoxin (DNA-binding transcriptional repressor) of toxin-antitoxin stability system
MSETIPLHRFRARLAEALRQVEHGKTVIVTRSAGPSRSFAPPRSVGGL